MPNTIQAVQTMSKTMRSKGNAVGLFAFPVVVFLAWALATYGYPMLSPASQNAIDNGGPGMLLGIVGGAILVASFMASWQSVAALRGARP